MANRDGKAVNHNRHMTSRFVTLAIWLAAIAGGLAWLLPLAGTPTPVPAQAAVAVAALPLPGGGSARVLGAPPVAEVARLAPPPAESRFKLLGVIASRRAGQAGLALISVDGQPARPIGVGREVDAGTRVLAVAHRSVDLGAGPGAHTLTLELPALPEAPRGVPGAATAAPAAPPSPLPPGVPTARPRGVPMMGATVPSPGRAPGVPAPAPPQAPIAVDPPAAGETTADQRLQ